MINIGKAFQGSAHVGNFIQGADPFAGVFIAPINGIYRMTFSSRSRNRIIDVFKGNYKELELNSISSTWMMKLVKGDKIRLYVDKRYPINVNSWTPMIFTGELIYIN